MSGSTHTISKAIPNPCAEGARADVSLVESNRRTGCTGNGSNGIHDIVSTNLLPLVALLETWNRRRNSGALALKLWHLAKHGRHWTPLGVAGSAVSDWYSIDSVLLCREKETGEVCLWEDVFACLWGILELLSNEELDVPEPEWVVGSIGASFAVLAGMEDE